MGNDAADGEGGAGVQVVDILSILNSAINICIALATPTLQGHLTKLLDFWNIH